MFEIELIICIKMDLALNYLQMLICHKNQPTILLPVICKSQTGLFSLSMASGLEEKSVVDLKGMDSSRLLLSKACYMICPPPHKVSIYLQIYVHLCKRNYIILTFKIPTMLVIITLKNFFFFKCNLSSALTFL